MIKKTYNIKFFLILIFLLGIFLTSAFSLAPRNINFPEKDYDRIVKDIGVKNTQLLKLLFEENDNQLVLNALINDPSLVPVFLIVPPDSEEIKIINENLFNKLGGYDFIDKYSAFVIGKPEVAEKVIKEGKSIILIGVKDRVSKNNIIKEFRVSNNRQSFFPLKNGLWLGVGGSGIFDGKNLPFYVSEGKKPIEPQRYQGIITGEKINTEDLKEISELKVKGNYFPQVIAYRRINNIPDGKGNYINADENDINPYLLFQIHMTPHRFNHFPQVLKNNDSFKKLIDAFNSSWSNIDSDFVKIENPKQYFNLVLQKWGSYRAELINLGYDKTTFHIQDLEVFGNIADDIEEQRMYERYGETLMMRFHILNILSIIHNIDVIAATTNLLYDSETDILKYTETFFDAYFSKLTNSKIIKYWAKNFSVDDPLYIWVKNIINELVIKDFEKNESLTWPKSYKNEEILFYVIFKTLEKYRGNIFSVENKHYYDFLLKSA